MGKRSNVDAQALPNNLQQTHTQLDERVKELDRRAFLTPSEQLELTELKRKKLAIKDRIYS